MSSIWLLFILHAVTAPCYSTQSNKAVVNNGDDATLHINISTFTSEGFLYLNDPHYNVVGVYTDSGLYYPGPLYNTTGDVAVSDPLIPVTIHNVDKTRHAGMFTCGYMHQEQILPNCGTLLVVRDIPTEPKIQMRHPAVYGHNVTLKCLSNSTSLPEEERMKLRFDWFQDGLQLQTGGQFTVARSRLTFNVTHREAHHLECIARDGTLKTNLSRTVFLPQYSPYGININASELIKQPEGSSLTVACTAVCKPPCRYEWSCLGNPRHGTENGILEFANIARRHGGTYNCVAKNKHGSQGTSIVLDVSYPPTCNVKGPEKNTVGENQTITLQCEVDSNPTPDVTWLKDGVIVTGKHLGRDSKSEGGVTKHIYKYEYRKKKAVCQDSGLYSCRVNNGIQPKAEETLGLRVNCAIRQMKNSPGTEKFTRPIQSTLEVNRSIMAFPRPRVVRWAIVDQGNERVVDETRFTTVWRTDGNGYMHTLTLRHTKLLAADDGKYNVELSNVAGPSSVVTYDIAVQASPEAPTDLTVLSLNDDSVTVGWTKGHNRNSEQRFQITMAYSGNQLVSQWTDEDTTQTTFSNLENGTEYTVRVRSRNNFGTSDYSAVLRVKIGTVMDGTSQDTNPRYDKEVPLWIATILGIVGLSLVVLLACFFAVKGHLKNLRLRERTPPQPQAVTNHEYDGVDAMAAGMSKEDIYDQIELESCEPRPPSDVYLRPAANMYTPIRHVDPRRTISVV